MSADTRFHETVRRWKQNRRRYELAAVLSVGLLGFLAVFIMVPIKQAIGDVEDRLEARDAARLMEDAERLFYFGPSAFRGSSVDFIMSAYQSGCIRLGRVLSFQAPRLWRGTTAPDASKAMRPARRGDKSPSGPVSRPRSIPERS